MCVAKGNEVLSCQQLINNGIVSISAGSNTYAFNLFRYYCWRISFTVAQKSQIVIHDCDNDSYVLNCPDKGCFVKCYDSPSPSIKMIDVLVDDNNARNEYEHEELTNDERRQRRLQYLRCNKQEGEGEGRGGETTSV